MTAESQKVPRNFRTVWLAADGHCPGAKRHFRGCAREVYGYIARLAEKDAFVFASAPKIAGKTRRWKDGPGPMHFSYTTRQIERVLRDFIRLEILSRRHRRQRGKVFLRGWEFRSHDVWAEAAGGLCQLRYFDRLTESTIPRQNVGADVVVFSRNVGSNVGSNVGDSSDILQDKWKKIRGLRFTGRLLAFNPLNLSRQPSRAHHAVGR